MTFDKTYVKMQTRDKQKQMTTLKNQDQKKNKN